MSRHYSIVLPRNFSPGLLLCLVLIALLVGSPQQLWSQVHNGRHFMINGNSPPGLSAQTQLLGDPHLNHVVQTVRLIAPQETKISVGGNGTFTPTSNSKVTVGMGIGPVYRFKIENLPNEPNKELYPSIELLNRLYTPAGLEAQFPVQVVIEKDDILQALEGRMVTKVIYLEDSQAAFPHRHRPDQQPVMEISSNQDPLRAAEKLGRPMAILRMGSRVPTDQFSDLGFGFHSPMPQILAEVDLPETEEIERIPVPLNQPR